MAVDMGIVADLAIILVVAGLVAAIFSRLRQPVVLGFIIAGIIVGPYTPPFSLVARLDLLHELANLGVILLLFGLGLEFPMSRLRGLGSSIIGIALIEILVMFLVSWLIGLALGLSFTASLFLGAALASSSTAIIVKYLSDEGKLKDRAASLILGILIVEDLAVIILLAVLQSYVAFGVFEISSLMMEVVKITLFIGGTLAVGGLVVPRFIDWLSKAGRPEILMATSVGMAFGMAFVGSFLGFSFAIGAFMMGVLVASARCHERVCSVIRFPKEMFGAIFFVSVGALIDVTLVRIFIIPATLITVGMVLGKMGGVGAATRLFGHCRNTALLTGLGMAQIGEFALIVMQTGLSLDVVSDELYSATAIAVLITTFMTPYLLAYGFRKLTGGEGNNPCPQPLE